MTGITLKNLSYAYADRTGSHKALDTVNLTVHPGEFLCLVGPSGCGKTTLLHILAGLLFPQSGTALLDDAPILGAGTDRSVVFQQYSLFPFMTALDNVAFGIRQAKHTAKNAARLEALTFLGNVGLEQEANRYPFQMSGGQRQRVAIARTLAMDSPILLMDEPFGALDHKNRTDLQNLLEEIWMGDGAHKTIVFVTHDIDEAIRLGDRVVYLCNGRQRYELPIPFSRPRRARALAALPEYRNIRAKLADRFTQCGYSDYALPPEDTV